MQLGRYILSNTHGSAKQKPSLTLWDEDGRFIAQCAPNTFDPLKYVRKHSRGKLARAFREQLEQAAVDTATINVIFGKDETIGTLYRCQNPY